MKLLTFFNSTFAGGIDYANAIWDVATKDTSINGLYLCLEDYLKEGYLGLSPNGTALTWYNMLADGNYLYGSNLTRVESSSKFNNKPCVEFSSTGNTQLLYRYPVTVGTLILVYYLKDYGSYIIYSPRNKQPPNPLRYDAFPSGYSTLWQYEYLNNGSVYYATSRINGNVVSPDTFTPLERTRVLSIKDLANPDGTEQIFGYGGQYGAVGGQEQSNTQLNSFKGSLAAVITYENSISDELLTELELVLADYYVQYDGASLTENPKFKNLINTDFYFDFSNIVTDEWFAVTSYTLIAPTTLGLYFSGTALQGYLYSLFDGKLVIEVSNSANITKQFEFDFTVCKQDPLAIQLPAQNNLSVVLSADKDATDGADYGLITNSSNQVIKWEDARRIGSVNTFNQLPDKLCTVLGSTPSFNNRPSVVFTNNSRLEGTLTTARTLLWVYVQDSYGTRNMLDTFPDIRGDGVLWTVPVTGQTHGTTPVTRLSTKVQNVPVSTLNYKVSLNTPYIITAITQDSDAVEFSGFDNMRGKLAFFAAWNIQLTALEIKEAVSLLATRYFSDLAPYIFSTSTEFRTQANVIVDLKHKVSDLRSLPLTYSLLTTKYDTSISIDGVLTVTAVKDEVIDYSIQVTNSDGLSSILNFSVDIAIRPNQMYLSLKSILGTSIQSIFIAELDSLSYSFNSIVSWQDYRLNGFIGTGTNLDLVSLSQLNGHYAADFNVNGSSHLTFPSEVTGRCFVIVYIRKESSTGRAFLFGQTSLLEFLSGLDGKLWDNTTSSKILNGTTYVNGKVANPNYVFSPSVVNVVVVNTTSNITINSVARDRTFTDRSIKGFVPSWFVLNRPATEQEAFLCNDYIRDYYDPARFILLLHFDGNILDSSVEDKAISSTSQLYYSFAKFGNACLLLVGNSIASVVNISNDIDFAHLFEDYQISFWLNINKALNTGDVLNLYNQTDIIIYIAGSRLCVGTTLNSGLALLTVPLPSGSYSTFQHIALCRQDKVLRLYISGQLVGAINDDREYRDYNTVVRLGQTNNLSTAGMFVYLDEVAVYKRGTLHSGDSFTPPQAPYS